MHMYIHKSPTTSQSQWCCSGVVEGGGCGSARRVCAKWVWVGANTLLTLAFLTMSSGSSSLEGFVFVNRHHSPSLMRQGTCVGLGGLFWFSSLDLLLTRRLENVEWDTPGDPSTEITILGRLMYQLSGFNIKIKESKTMLKVNLFLLTKSKHLELPVLKSTENCKLPPLLLAKLYRARCVKTLEQQNCSHLLSTVLFRNRRSEEPTGRKPFQVNPKCQGKSQRPVQSLGSNLISGIFLTCLYLCLFNTVLSHNVVKQGQKHRDWP